MGLFILKKGRGIPVVLYWKGIAAPFRIVLKKEGRNIRISDNNTRVSGPLKTHMKKKSSSRKEKRKMRHQIIS